MMAKRKDKAATRIADILEAALPKETIIDVSPSGVRDNLHVLVVSRALDPKTEPQKQNYLWGLLEAAVEHGELDKAELDRISLILPLSVGELRR
jgi:hypothetical protein